MVRVVHEDVAVAHPVEDAARDLPLGEERVREYPNQIALHLLKMHRETAIEDDSDVPAADVAEIRERLVRKLQRLKKRDEAQEAGPQQLRDDAPRKAHPDERDGGSATPSD